MSIENKREESTNLQNVSRRDFCKLVGLTSVGLLVGCDSDSDQQADDDRIQTEANEIALINGTLIDGTGANALPDSAIVIRGKRITAVGPRSQVEIPADAEMIDVQGGTILPGFFNAHVHTAYSENRLKAWARGGVTTVRDLHVFGGYNAGVFDTRDALCAMPECARLIAAGSFVNVAGGYPIAYWGGHAITVTSTEEARHAVNRVVDEGAEVIKTAFESGYAYGQSGWPVLSPEQAKALVETAHGRGKPVTAHVTSGLDLKKALDAGVDEIAHMVVDGLNDELISRMVGTGTRWVTTLELWQGISNSYGAMSINNLNRFVEAGGEAVLGTDYAGAPDVNFDLGMPITEIKLMRQAGMTSLQIIFAATRNSARSCNMESELGTLEVGKLADVLIVTGDPLADIYALTNPLMVLREGRSI